MGADSLSMTPITFAEIIVVEVDLRGYRLSYGTIDKIKIVLIKLIDADGVVGWGEADPMKPFTTESADEVAEILHDELLPAVLHEANPEPEHVDEVLDALRNDHLLAKGAISMALLDIKGKKLGVPVAELLGKVVHTSLPLLWPLSNGSAEADIAVIETKSAEGYRSFMLKMGAAPVNEEIERVNTLYQRYGKVVKFIADANQGWSFDDTQTFLEGVKDTHLAFVEQPVAKGDLQSMYRLTNSGLFPISADESLTGLVEANDVAENRAANVFSIKSSKNGGPLRARAITEVAQKYGIRCYMNSMLELGVTQAASLQLAVTIPHLIDVGHAYMSTLRLDGDPTNFASFIHNAVVNLPERPGLGIDVDEAKLHRIAVSSRQLPGL